jgi:hypothetical protein
MADAQEIKGVVESIIGSVFDKRMAELRKDLHKGVGESMGSRVSELQLDVETGVADMFSSDADAARTTITKAVSEVLSAQIRDLDKDIEKGVAETIHAQTGEIRNQIAQGVAEVLGHRAGDLKRDFESSISGLFAERMGDFHKEIERLVAEATGQRVNSLRQELEKKVEESAQQRIQELLKDVERVVNERAESRVEVLRKDVHRVVLETTEKRSAGLREEVEKIVSETTEKRFTHLRKEVERVVGEVAETRVATIQKDVERVVAEAGEQRIEDLRKDLTKKVAEEMEPLTHGKGQEAPVSALLDSALLTIQGANSQTDVLRALLDGAAHFSSRVALFVVKGESAAGWQARGFDENSTIKKLSVETGKGLAGKAVSGRIMASGTAAEFDTKLVAEFGGPKQGNACVVPLVVRDKIPALLYADAGTRGDGESDSAALQMLARTAGLWLEVLILRKNATSASVAIETAPSEQTSAAVAEETAAHVPEPKAVPVAVAASAAPAAPAVTAEDEEIHKKARRFAKLLVDEIKLYNQAKVNEGRQHKDLYSRLREDIEKSRSSYDKRYGNTSAASADYFNQEVVKVLAENDVAVLGSGFPGR